MTDTAHTGSVTGPDADRFPTALAARLHAFSGSSVQGLHAVRMITGGSLRYAKMYVYDQVRAGHSVSIPITGLGDIDLLEQAGWAVSADTSGMVTFTATVPAGKVEQLAQVVRDLGGRADIGPPAP